MTPRPAPPAPAEPLIPYFYSGRSVFITGATGFMGKVLVERLLSTCPEIGRLFLLVRTKKDLTPDKRLIQLKQSQVFDLVRERCPRQLDKLVAVAGDVSLPHLGVHHKDLPSLREVSVVFHSAATIKFNEPLKEAVNQNIRSVLRVMEICDRLPNVQVFIHVSTAYSNTEHSFIEEKVYPAPVRLDELLALTDAVSEDILAEITPKYISPKPNTYTFTKAMAEVAVAEKPNRKYQAAIFRPSIVISSVRDPQPGWIENLNGPSGVVVGAGKGLLHVLRCAAGAAADMIPVDVAIDTLIAVAADTALNPSNEVLVYNCCSFENPITWGRFKNELFREARQHPFDRAFWYPFGLITNNSVLHGAYELLFQKIPLYTAECLVKLCGVKTQLSLITVYRRLRAMDEVLEFFATHEWRFATDNVRRLREKMTLQDSAIYNLDPNTIDWKEHLENFVKGSRKYLLKEKDENISTAKQHMRKLHYVHRAVMLALAFLLCRLLLPSFLFTVKKLRLSIAKLIRA